MTKKILLCIDSSSYADNICAHGAWAAKRLKADIELLHVVRAHADLQAPGHDHTGAIGLGAKSKIREELTKIDEERGQIEQKKGRLILAHGEEILRDAGIDKIKLWHRRGNFEETVQELEKDVDLVFIGKRGEQANVDSQFLGSNLEKIARITKKPLFLASATMRPMQRFLIAYDGKNNAKKAIDYVANSALFKGLECHILSASKDDTIDINSAVNILEKAGLNVISHVGKTANADNEIINYVSDKNIDLLITGAYSHSKIRTMLMGSITAKLIKSCRIPLILFSE